jgi:O-antigen ligase
MSIADSKPAWHERGAFLCIAGLLFSVPFIFVPTASEAFRAPKLLASDVWGLASLVFLAVGLRGVGVVAPRELWRAPAVRVTLPLLGLALASRFTSSYPLGVAGATAELAIGAACLVGWSLGLPAGARERLLGLLRWPAAALALLALLQLTGLYRPFGFSGTQTTRMGVTSLAGNAGDLGAYLVLPCLLLQARLLNVAGARRAWTAGLLALAVGGLVATQTFTALAACVLGSLLFWGQRLPRRRAALVLAAGVGLTIVLLFSVQPLRERTLDKAKALLAGDWDQLLTYRLDGWRAATWMLGQHPIAGVGHGAYRSSYAGARLALTQGGADFSGQYRQLTFFNAHNDALEVGAELGWPGLLALGFAVLTLAQALRRTPSAERALGIAGAASLALLAVAGFPFETALIVYPWLLFLSGFLGARQENPRRENRSEVATAAAKARNPPAPARAHRRKR